MDARSKIIFVSLVVPVRSGNSVISRASDNSLKIFKLDLYNIVLRRCILNKNIIMSSFKSSRDIQKKEGGPDSCFG